ncbi:MAG: DUF296 domain-containing protein [bacterium]
MIEQYGLGRLFLGRLEHGADLLAELHRVCESESIRMGTLQVIGAVQRACVGFYHQREKRYQQITIPNPSEILCCLGNISFKDGKVFIHAHITLSDEEGNARGGHLMSETTIFAAEFQIQELQGKVLQRHEDSVTGLALWSQGA